MRTLIHPGPVYEKRILARLADNVQEHRIYLPAGVDLLDTLLKELTLRGIANATAQLIAGEFDYMQYLTGGPDPTGHRVATYGAPTHVSGGASLVSGNVICGLAPDGLPSVHCHAVVVDGQGQLHGGHLPPGTSKLGAAGAVALVTSYTRSGFKVTVDAETNYSVFEPVNLELV